MKKANKIFNLFAAIMICFLLSVNAAAQSSSITVTLNALDGSQVEGNIPLALYRVADFDGSVYTLSDEFFESGVTLESLDDYDAAKLYSFALSQGIKAEKRTVKVKSSATFDVPQGVYLVSSSKDENGNYKAFKPFFVWLPYVSDNGKTLLYDIECEPKLELDSVSEPTEPKTITPNPKQVKNFPAAQTDSKLPQTGMLWWPVLLLSVIGIIMFAVGWTMRFAFSHE